MDLERIPDYAIKNYYIKDGYAYTEDDIMVYKLFVSKIPHQTTVGMIRNDFSQFGRIKNVRFFTSKVEDYYNVASVYFESPIAVARVLYLHYIACVDSSILSYHIKACDSWHQPNCQPTKYFLYSNCLGTKESKENEIVAPNRDSILILNDDCLEHIIRLLPISYQLHFARSCSRICQIFNMTCKSLYRTLVADRLDGMSKWMIRDFFDFAGAHIIRMKGELPLLVHDYIVKYKSIFCINIEELDIEYNPLTVCNQHLFVQIFPKMKKLKTLKLSYLFEISGQNLCNLPPTIERLSVDCVALKDNDIANICKTMRNLKELNLGKCLCLNDESVKALATCENIETLTITIAFSDYGLFAKLPKLKNLTVIVSKTLSSLFFTQLIEHKSKYLQFLRIEGMGCRYDDNAQQISHLKELRTLDCSYTGLTDIDAKYFCNLEHLEVIKLIGCYRITNTALLNLVLKCKKLKRVDVNGCVNISNYLIFDLMQKMQEQIRNKTFMRTEPVLLNVAHTQINKNILQDANFHLFQHIIIHGILDEEIFEN